MEPVLVVGAGPVGLTTALLLANWQIPTVVLEAAPGHEDIGSRAICFQRDVLDIFDRVGVRRRHGRRGPDLDDQPHVLPRAPAIHGQLRRAAGRRTAAVHQRLPGQRRTLPAGPGLRRAADHDQVRLPGDRDQGPRRPRRSDGRSGRPAGHLHRQPPGRRRRRPQHGPPPARHRLRRQVLRRPVPDLRHPGGISVSPGATVLPRPGLESRPAGAGAPLPRRRLADRLAGPGRVRPGVRAGRRRPATRRSAGSPATGRTSSSGPAPTGSPSGSRARSASGQRLRKGFSWPATPPTSTPRSAPGA